MATAGEIVKQAFREGNLVAISATTGEPVTTTGQDAEGLSLLNRFIKQIMGIELGELAFDWPVPPSITSPIPARYPVLPENEQLASNVWPYPPGNVRLLLRLTANTTIYLPQNPDDGARIEVVNLAGATGYSLTLDANGRLVKGSSTVTDTDENLNGQTLFYRADLGDWTLLPSTLASTTDSPLPELYDDLLAIGVFIRLAPRYGRAASSETATAYAAQMKRLKAQYRQKVPMRATKQGAFIVPASDPNSNKYWNGGRLY